MRGWAGRIWDWLTGREDTPAPPPEEIPQGTAVVGEDDTHLYVQDPEAARREAMMPVAIPGILASQGYPGGSAWADPTPMFSGDMDVTRGPSAATAAQEQMDTLRRYARAWELYPDLAAARGVPKISKIPKPVGYIGMRERWAAMSAAEKAAASGIEWSSVREVLPTQIAGGLASVHDSLLAFQLSTRLKEPILTETLREMRERFARERSA